MSRGAARLTVNSRFDKMIYINQLDGKTNWNLKREVRAPNNTVIPNQCAHWCGNLHRIPGSLSSYIPLFCTISIVC